MLNLRPTALTRILLGQRLKKGRRPGQRPRTALGEQLELRLLLTGPTANPDTYYDDYNATINIPAYAGVLANDTGGGPLSAVLVSGPSAGTLTLHSDGSLIYTNTSFPMSGTDAFTYEAFDGTNDSAPTSVTIEFGNNQPTISTQSYSVLHGQTLTVAAANGVLDGATDPNNLNLTAVLESGPGVGHAHGGAHF